MLQFQCPHCSGIFQIDSQAAGQQVACPLCQGVVAIGQVDGPAEPPVAFEPPPVMAPAVPNVAVVREPGVQQLACPWCNGSFQVTADMVGQQVACPHCNESVSVPVAEAGPFDPPPVVEHAEPAPPPAAEAIAAGQPTAVSTDPMAPASIAATADIHAVATTAAATAVLAPEQSTRKIVVGDKVVEIRRLTPEQRARRRFTRNLVMIGICVVIMICTLAFIQHRQQAAAPPPTDGEQADPMKPEPPAKK
ncbi:MAG: hypothetical protein K8T25_07755 [Planctomycetia bacterium]|nr:hypothetical protein [Planctomycetia bacterium]